MARLPAQLKFRRRFLADLAALLVALNGLLMLAGSLLSLLSAHRHGQETPALNDLRLILGLGLLYLAVMLMRRKKQAWQLAIGAYVFILALAAGRWLTHTGHSGPFPVLQSLAVPLAVLIFLLLTHQAFTVRSDVAAFRSTLQVTLLVLIAALAYGVFGFMLLDNHDFHQEISVPAAIGHTLDQFALVDQPLQPHTRRARLFLDSLSTVSIAAVGFAAVSFFQPVRQRLRSHDNERLKFLELLHSNYAPSEDYFKIWPHDKQYFFSASGQAGLAYAVKRGVALVQGDPVGTTARVGRLLDSFEDVCRSNDWSPAFIHIDDRFRKQYQDRGYKLQVIGQEAVIKVADFETNVAGNKYFRNIRNRFDKAGYRAELVQPPHSQELLRELQAVSDDWLAKPGRAERGFVMGYFSYDYIQRCPLLIARGSDGQLQGFINIIPADFDKQELTYDLLRQRAGSLSNCNDFLMTNLIKQAAALGYERVNMGLSPLANHASSEKDKETVSLIDNAMAFAYANGDRFYSFSGLFRFKDKYKPVWSDRYIAYRGSIAAFSRVTGALLQLCKQVAPKK